MTRKAYEHARRVSRLQRRLRITPRTDVTDVRPSRTAYAVARTLYAISTYAWLRASTAHARSFGLRSVEISGRQVTHRERVAMQQEAVARIVGPCRQALAGRLP